MEKETKMGPPTPLDNKNHSFTLKNKMMKGLKEKFKSICFKKIGNIKF